ncbi:MAG: VCBS repeat-containing protein, partial [candidate division SR1 bacterium]|nr:VCBS repeat-containing protein [candidate division SR1 bacterium]
VIPHLDYAKSTPLSNDGKLEDSRWIFSETYQGGTTNRLAKGIFEVGNSLDTNYQGYDSIQNSNDFKKYIGFRADFKNVTLFAGGKSVGESTIPFGSEFLINIGDPLLKRIQKNTNLENTDYNGGIEKTIYSDTTNSIWKVLDIDYNRDGLKDILVIYQDGTIKLQKQYADKQFQDMGMLMMTTEQMEDVYVGDIDGNGYEDILIRNSKQQFRAYLNDDGIFDVDGRIACLNTNVKNGEISEYPSVLSGVHQVFVRDMDLDKKLDIVTYDRMGDIKVFYGNGDKNNHSYLSTNEYSCDDNWRKRQQNSVKTIHNLGVEIDNHAVRDESLVRWGGLKIPSNEELTTQAAEGATQNITDQIPGNVQAMLNGQQTVNPDAITNSITKTDMTSAVASTIGTYTKYLQNPVKEQLVLNDGLPAKDQAFFTINTLDSKDKVDVTKEYRDINGENLLDNDIVEVRVRIKANASISSGAFLDKPYLPAKIK